MSEPHEFMHCQPGSCALPHPLPAPDEPGCHWPYGNVFFGGSRPYRHGDPICMLTEAQHRVPCFMCDPSILAELLGLWLCPTHAAPWMRSGEAVRARRAEGGDGGSA